MAPAAGSDSRASLPTPQQVFILAGQSNMTGRGQPLSLAPRPRSQVQLWRNGGWIVAADPLDTSTGAGVGLGVSFGERVSGLEHDAPVGLVMCAVNGTHIVHWLPRASTGLYRSCVAQARATGVPVAGVLFFQGESDATTYSDASTWAGYFQQILNAFRADFGPGLPVVLGSIGRIGVKYPYQQLVRDQQRAASAANNLPLVLTTDLPMVGTSEHFTAAGYKTLGERFANAWWSCTQRSVCARTSFATGGGTS